MDWELGIVNSCCVSELYNSIRKKKKMEDQLGTCNFDNETVISWILLISTNLRHRFC